MAQDSATPALTRATINLKVSKPATKNVAATWLAGPGSPVPDSLKFMQWTVTNAGMEGSALSIQACITPPLDMHMTDSTAVAALKKVNVLEHRLTLQASNNILYEMYLLGLWDKVYSRFSELLEAYTATRKEFASNAAFSVVPSMTIWGEPFDTPAVAQRGRVNTAGFVAAAPLQRGPSALRYLHITTWDLLWAPTDLPLLALAKIFLLLGECSLRVSRLDEASEVCLAGEILTGLVQEFSRLKDPSPALLAIKLAEFVKSPSASLPTVLQSPDFTPAQALAEVIDAWTLWSERPEQRGEGEMRLLKNTYDE